MYFAFPEDGESFEGNATELHNVSSNEDIWNRRTFYPDKHIERKKYGDWLMP